MVTSLKMPTFGYLLTVYMAFIKYLSLSLLLCSLQIAQAQRVSYIVSFPNLAHHEALVQLIVTDIPTRTAVFRMSRS